MAHTHSTLSQHFTNHPGHESGDHEAVFGTGNTRDKRKVWCKEHHRRRVQDIHDTEIIRQLWLNEDEGWHSSRSDALWAHLRKCEYQPEEIRDQAEARYQENLLRRRNRRLLIKLRNAQHAVDQDHVDPSTSSATSSDPMSEALGRLHLEEGVRAVESSTSMHADVGGEPERVVNADGASLMGDVASNDFYTTLADLLASISEVQSSPTVANDNDVPVSYGCAQNVETNQWNQDTLMHTYAPYDIFNGLGSLSPSGNNVFTAVDSQAPEPAGPLYVAFYDPHIAAIF